MAEAVLQVKNVNLKFPLYSAESRSFRNAIRNVALGSRIGVNSAGKGAVEALRDINLSLYGGDRLGLVGSNGAGKTTLLKLLAGIYAPTQGGVLRNGIVTTLFDIGLGMDGDATGLENIYLASYLRGMQKKNINDITDEIVEFAELHEFIHMPVRTYSAGMATRLAFSLATAFTPDILLVDEVFGTGDAKFIKKSEKRMADLMSNARVLVIASHNTEIIKKFCNKALLMRSGQQIKLGDVDDILSLHASEL